jgi:ubiquinone/menaquinone biosynthesis C-methylase UbiE
MGASINQGSQSTAADYENYSQVAKTYDETRIPVGVEIILGCFAATGTQPLHEQAILDAGSGTGNYLQVIHEKVGSCYGIEINQDMLSQAQARFATISNVHLDHGSLLSLPYDDNFFDGIMCNQVIHHLEAQATEDFPNIQTMFTALYRVLRVGGVVIVNTCSRQQLLDGYWWAELIPKAVGRMSIRIPSIEQTVQMLEDVGFHLGGVIVPLHEVLQGPSYFDPKAPLNKSFREGDSTWSLLSDEELSQALEYIRRINEDGCMKDYLDRSERKRKQVGQTTFIFARKP